MPMPPRPHVSLVARRMSSNGEIFLRTEAHNLARGGGHSLHSGSDREVIRIGTGQHLPLFIQEKNHRPILWGIQIGKNPLHLVLKSKTQAEDADRLPAPIRDAISVNQSRPLIGKQIKLTIVFNVGFAGF